MPQMMPLLWTHMLIFSTLMMLILISFIYFFIPYNYLSIHQCKEFRSFLLLNKKLWNWKW